MTLEHPNPENRTAYFLRALLVAVVGTVFASCGNSPSSPSYRAFLNQDLAYYHRIAEGCDELLRSKPAGETPAERELKGDDKTLPVVLKGLHASGFLVGTNRVYIGIGPPTKSGWGIIWEQDDEDPVSWELRTNGDGVRTVLLSVKKTLAPGTSPAKLPDP
jgi:hypothetical protein